jgi:glutamate-1-semialdehyde 2,1-aminomutase
MFGKVVGGGLPLAAVGGRAEVMDRLAPVGDVYQAGTLSGNPLATAAGLAVLELLDDAVYRTIEARATALGAGLESVFGAAGIPVQVSRVATLLGLFFTDAPVTDYESAKRADHERYARFFHAMLDRGVFLAPSGYETTFVSLAHTDEVLEQVVAAAADAAGELAR